MAVYDPERKDLLAPFATSGSSSSPSLCQRRIEFHPARKQFNGFGSDGGDFKIETLNPSASQPGGKHGAGGPGQASGKKVDGLELVESWLDPELSFGASVQRIVRNAVRCSWRGMNFCGFVIRCYDQGVLFGYFSDP